MNAPRTLVPADPCREVGKHVLVDGFGIVLDLEKSHGCRLVDASRGRELLDLYGCFSSLPIGFNHRHFDQPEVCHELLVAARVGKLFLQMLCELGQRYPFIEAPRGRGLMIAFDLPTRKLRDRFHRGLFELDLLALRGGERTIRFRPALDLPEEAVGEAIDILTRQCRRMGKL